MTEPFNPTTLTSLSGSLMSLFGILVSLFSVHLGNWLAKLQGMRTKWNANNAEKDDEVKARREVRYSFAEIYTWQPLVMTIVLLCFAASVVGFFVHVWVGQAVAFPSIFPIIYIGFFVIMGGLEIFLLVTGRRVGSQLDKDIKEWVKNH